MPYFPLALQADDRSDRGVNPTFLQNMLVEPVPAGSVRAARSQFMLTAGWGSTVFSALPQGPVRGLFARDGVVNGEILAVSGERLYQISSSGVATEIGPIIGGGVAQFDALDGVALIVTQGRLYTYDGSALTQVTDADLPASLSSVTVSAARAVVSRSGSDQYHWSQVSDATDWDSADFATAEQRPDLLVAVRELRGEVWLFGRATTEVVRPTGTTPAFQNVGPIVINVGAICPCSVVSSQDELIWLGHDRIPYRADGYSAQPLYHPALYEQLSALSDADLKPMNAYIWRDGGRSVYALVPKMGPAWFYDLRTGLWSTRTTWQASAYQYAYHAYAFGRHFVSGPSLSAVHEWSRTAHSDAGAVIERVASVSVPVPTRTQIASVAIDADVWGQPATGQGSDPEIMLTWYRDGGHAPVLGTGVERRMRFGRLGERQKSLTTWRLGYVNARDGAILQVRFTDPIGVVMYGVAVNDGAP